jgi:hypothetical protein
MGHAGLIEHFGDETLIRISLSKDDRGTVQRHSGSDHGK